MNNMKLEIGKLYKVNFDRHLYDISGSNSYARAESICLLLDFKLRKNNIWGYNKYKIITKDGIIGWVDTVMDPEILFSTNIE